MNFLFTCAGRRNYLLDYFRVALNDNGLILAADGSAHAPALQAADKSFVLPYINAPEYIDELLALCRREQVDAVISLNDLELPVLADKISLFKQHDVILLVSNTDVINICFDKWKTHQFLTNAKIDSPISFISLNKALDALDSNKISYPVVLKPRWGTGSIGIEYPQNRHELKLAYELLQSKLTNTILSDISSTDFEHSLIIQEYLDGEEFGLDIINDLEANYQSTIVKKKLAMRAGETDKAVIMDIPDLATLGEKISHNLQHIVNLDCDIFRVDGKDYVLEMNPRFGGGFPFSYVAGVDLPKAIINWLNKESTSINLLQPKYGILSAKYDQLVIINNT